MIGVGLPGIGEALEVGPQHDRWRPLATAARGDVRGSDGTLPRAGQ